MGADTCWNLDNHLHAKHSGAGMRCSVGSSVQVLDINGKLVSWIDKPVDQTIAIDLASQPVGIYLLELKLQEVDQPLTLKIVRR